VAISHSNIGLGSGSAAPLVQPFANAVQVVNLSLEQITLSDSLQRFTVKFFRKPEA
jgi:hypothetical protein